MRTSTWVHPRTGRPMLVAIPSSRRERVRGLRSHNPLEPDRMMLFERCRSVHTFGMGFPIRVVALDGDMVVHRVRVMGPWRLLLPRPAVRHILECHADADIRPGDRFAPLVRGLSAAGGKPRATLRPSRR